MSLPATKEAEFVRDIIPRVLDCPPPENKYIQFALDIACLFFNDSLYARKETAQVVSNTFPRLDCILIARIAHRQFDFEFIQRAALLAMNCSNPDSYFYVLMISNSPLPEHSWRLLKTLLHGHR